MDMDRLKQFKTYPFGLFLWLEWIFLGALILGYLPNIFVNAKYRIDSDLINIALIVIPLCIILLGGMGLKLPRRKTLYKWMYFTVQLVLVLLPAYLTEEISYCIYSCLIVTVRNCLVFKQKECWLANIILLLSLIPCIISVRNFEDFQARVAKYQAMTIADYEKVFNMGVVSNVIEAALCMTLIWIIVNVVLREYKSQQQLALAREQLRQYALQAEDRATVCERNRIAREIHDSVGHALTAQSIQLHNAIAFWQSDPIKAYQFLLESQGLVKTALKDIRHSVSTLRSDPLQGKKLDSAIASLCHTFFSRTKVMPNFSFILNRPLTEEIELTVYRIVQEALTNIIKHSQPTAVNLKIQTFSEHLNLSIKDNGQGFNPKQNTTGFGLQGMSERVFALNGDIKIDSSLGCGCTITINIPLESSL